MSFRRIRKENNQRPNNNRGKKGKLEMKFTVDILCCSRYLYFLFANSDRIRTGKKLTSVSNGLLLSLIYKNEVLLESIPNNFEGDFQLVIMKMKLFLGNCLFLYSTINSIQT